MFEVRALIEDDDIKTIKENLKKSNGESVTWSELVIAGAIGLKSKHIKVG